MNTYIYVLRLPERLYEAANWTEEEGNIVSAHFQYLKENVEKGVVILAGRTDQTDSTGFGIVIFQAENEEAAEHFKNHDPAVQQGVMTVVLSRYRLALLNEQYSLAAN
ncbi:MAG: YciI family protein [Bacillota bacterium]